MPDQTRLRRFLDEVPDPDPLGTAHHLPRLEIVTGVRQPGSGRDGIADEHLFHHASIRGHRVKVEHEWISQKVGNHRDAPIREWVQIAQQPPFASPCCMDCQATTVMTRARQLIPRKSWQWHHTVHAPPLDTRTNGRFPQNEHGAQSFDFVRRLMGKPVPGSDSLRA